MIRMRCSTALNLDGGGSSTLVMKNTDGIPTLINRPSDGHDLIVPMSFERAVANVFGVTVSIKAD